MDIRLELIQNEIASLVCKRLPELDIDIDKVVQTNAVKALDEIKAVLESDPYSDFDIVEGIIGVFEKYNISYGSCHDFG